MSASNERHEWDTDDTLVTAHGRPRPTRSRSRKKTLQRRKPKARRNSQASDSAKRGIHQRRNKRLSW